MKKIYLLLLLLTTYLGAEAFNVTFSVDLNGSGLSNASLNGTFNGWCGYCAPMTDSNADGIWDITLDLAAGTYEYKFTANSGSNWENLTPGSSCTITTGGFTNRALTVSADATLPTVCFASCNACNQAPPTYPITFSVDMNGVTGFTTPTVNGSFDGWCGNCNPMTDANSDGIWELTKNLPAGNYEYKFAYDSWAGQENLTPGSSCTMTTGGFTNRTLAVSAAATVGTVCWGSCTACNVLPTTYDVTFKVDMSQYAGNFTTPEVNGTFNNWCGNCNAMSDANGDDIWEVTLNLPAGNYEYKFAHDAWTGQENLTPGSSCTMTMGANTNRVLSLSANTTLTAVCWGSCNACSTAPGCTDMNAVNYDPAAGTNNGSCLYATTFNVEMNCTDPFTNVYITGPWCGWCAAETYNLLTDANADGFFNVTLNLPAGNVEYKYMVDNWASQENLVDDVQNGGTCAPVTDGVNYANRQIVVGTTTNDTYGKCSTCSGIVLDPCDLLTLAFDDAGSLTNWSTVADATLPEASMTWDATGALRLSGSNTATAIGRAYIFQYLNNAVNYNANTTVQLEFDVKSVGALVGTALHLQTEFPGTGVTNTFDIQNAGLNENTWTHYTYTFNNVAAASNFRMHFNMAAGAFLGAGGTLLVDNIELNCYTPVIIAGCTDPTALNYNAAATEDDGSCTYPQTYNVTFQVDMTQYAGTFTTPEVNGTFNGWCGNCNAMSDANGDDIWEVTLNLPAGNYEYKFAHDAWTGQENLTSGSSCTVTNSGFTNRALSVTGTTTLATVCWGSCTACNVLPSTYDVTFKVDMSQYSGNFNTPEVNGTFNGWCGNCNAMSDANGDDIWEVTLNLPAGNYEYKFAYDSWAGQEALTAGSSCTVTTGAFTNRTLTVSANTTLPAVCWESCTACTVNSTPGCTNMSAVNYNAAAGIDDGTCLFATNFNVDMNCTDPFTNVYITGPWCGWCGADTYNILTDANADGIYSVSVNLAAGNVEYKYMVDNWASQENLVDDVQNGGTCAPITDGANYANRQIVVGTTTNDTYGKCTSCGGVTPDPCDILTVAFDDAGSLSSWTALADATLPEASMTWDATGALRLSGSNTATAIGRAYIFEYLNNAVNYNGNSTVQLEFDVKSVGALVGTALHLQTEFPGTGVTNTFDIQNAGINENTWTHYSYTFNGVTAASLFRMHFNMAAGAFLGAGGTLLVDNIELNCYTPVIIAGCTDPTALNYNAAATEDDGSCTYPQTYNVTFQVDMTQYAGTFTTPEVNGTFNGWCGNCNAMSDANGDNIWEVTIPLTGGTYEYKFAHDSWAGQENLTAGSPCTVTAGPYTNRLLNLTADVVLPAVCWASCSSCGIAPVSYSVTFQVDMQNVTGFTTPEINGTFNNWCGGCFVMTDANGDNIWEGTTVLEEGTYEFKYAYDSWTGSEQLTPGDACTITDGAFTNRLLSVTEDIVLPVVCWASCSDCGGTATPVDVTFQVDMSQYLGSFTTPEVNGTFNNWCGGCAPMSDANGDNKWELTIPLIPGTYEYKFAFDSWLGQENLVPGSTCTITTDLFTNRVITVIDAETLPAVCWESCELCIDFVDETSNTLSVYPNPSNGNIRINSNLALPYNVEVFDLSGRKVQDMKVFQSNTEINLENLSKGAYQIRVSNNFNSVRETVIIN